MRRVSSSGNTTPSLSGAKYTYSGTPARSNFVSHAEMAVPKDGTGYGVLTLLRWLEDRTNA